MNTHLKSFRAATATAATAAVLFGWAGSLPAQADAKTASAPSVSTDATTGLRVGQEGSHTAAALGVAAATPKVTTARLNLRSGPGTTYRVIKVLAKGTKVTVTGSVSRGFAPVIAGTTKGWVSNSYLTAPSYAPAPTPRDALEAKLTPAAIALHRAGLKAWPQVKTYYGYRNDPTSDHSRGAALDLMIPSYKTAAGKALGQNVANWAVANHETLGIHYVIWNQKIWNVGRADDGWRAMADRGNDSANHKNHVHISVF